MNKILATGLCLALLASGANAQQPAKTAPKKTTAPAKTLSAKAVAAGIPAELKQPIPFDPDVKVGKLPNGLTYYIRKNAEPKNRAELRLAVNAGSILETDDQQGLAHFMEHMAFNGTKNFPKNELVSFLQSSGIRFGADLNASTGFDETVYQLPVPTDSARLFERAFQILEDWAHNVTMDPTEIDKERGIILEEARSGRGAGQRMREKYYPLILNNARYTYRLPIGKDDIIKTFKPEALQRFYKDWYRPDLMAVVAVGDFDVAQVEGMIREKFGRIPAVNNPKPRLKYPIPPHKDTKIAIVTDPEQPNTMVQIMYKRPEIKEKTLYDVREAIKRVLFNSMIGNRINELTQQSDPPFLGGYSNYGGFLGDQDAFSSYVVAKDGNVNRAVTAILDENARVDRFGFTETELERAKKQYQKYVDRAYRERDKTRSTSYVSEYVENFLHGDIPVSISFYNDFTKKYLNGITVGDVNNLAKQFITTENRVVVIMAPEKDKAKLPTEKEILALIDNAGKNLTAYVDKTLDKPLLSTLPVGNPVTSEKEIKDINVTEWTLRNGVKVVLKPTDFKNDQIIFSANSPGGTSIYNDKDFESARFASPLTQMSGIGEYSQIQLGKYLTGKTVSVSPYIGETTEGFSGSTTPDDLETALQLVYAYFTAPRKDPDVIRGFLSNQKSALQNQQATPTPQKVFQDTVQSLLGAYHYRRLPMTPDRLEKVDVDRAGAIYKDRFADASDFTFFFVGNFKEKDMKPLIEKYLGGLPVTNRKENYRDLGIRIPAGKIEKTVVKGLEPKSTVQLVFSGDFVWNTDNTTQVDALAEVLEIKLIETLREEESGVYGVSVNGAYSKIPAQRYTLRIGFGCAPENVDKLIARTLAEIDKLKQNGAESKDIDKFKAETRRETELQLKQNGFWLGYLSNQYFNNDAPDEILHEAEFLKQVTPESTKQAANLYFGKNYIKLLLVPERKP
ncbi:M16 family metallopeptidase [Larkinella rosea]|uniref:Insulinase family protein n=1 Tax=Larkinella rosea TaxID=2025312 RepID=A0A3P1BAE7_9BACT|nr:insulinase family protein [Larkinella rosea]RRA98050.1 insulinase family protein [Larkinella rosea]